MKKKLVSLIALALALTAFSGLPGFSAGDVEAATPTFQKVNFTNGTVTASYLNVRQGPATTYKVVCVLKKGQKVKVFGKVGNWYAIYETPTGCVGAVSSKYVKIASSTATTAPKTTTPSKPAAPLPTPQTTPSTGASQEEQALMNLVNKARADAGAGALQFDTNLMKVARLKAKDMVDNNYFSHQSPTYGSPFDMMRQFGVEFKTAGENIAGNQTVSGAFNAWMNSPGHKANILNDKFNYAGFGIVSSSTYGKILVQQFVGR